MLPFRKRTKRDFIKESKQTPRTSSRRQQASLTESPFDVPQLLQDVTNNTVEVEDTVLYLGYASNLSAETFRGKRGIRPLSQVNVVVPEIALTFNLPGVPYSEPCFANTRYRDTSNQAKRPIHHTDYHKDRWHKGLVGVVYEVTKKDFAHIIATEGGGSGYKDVLVDCYELDGNPREKVPAEPNGSTFKAHTLFAPVEERPDPSYAQPSPRYKKLMTDGAAEHSLPYEYQDFLHQLRPYRITNTKQRLGQFVFTSVWAPLFLFIFGGLAAIFLRPDGTYPVWFQRFARSLFRACWSSYDGFFRPLFGDGERTLGDTDHDRKISSDAEKAPLIQETIARYGIGGRLVTEP